MRLIASSHGTNGKGLDLGGIREAGTYVLALESFQEVNDNRHWIMDHAILPPQLLAEALPKYQVDWVGSEFIVAMRDGIIEAVT